VKNGTMQLYTEKTFAINLIKSCL